jgi:lipid-A-disaccharide synthase
MYKRQIDQKILGETTGGQMSETNHAQNVLNDQFSISPNKSITPCISPDKGLIGILPGSRAQEISRVLPEMLKIARALHTERPGLRFVTPCTNEARAAQIRGVAGDFPLEVIVGGMQGVLSSAGFCLVASGTATLETAVFGVPFIILYRVSPLTYVLARLLVDIEHIGMVNILAGRGVVPEYIQGDIRVPQILPQALSLIDDTPAREQMLRDLAEVRGKLGGGGASENAAREILSAINGHA